jgi:methyltransferase (TIGR00027 family)
MTEAANAAPDSTAVRVALWRAMHLQVDEPPYVLEDEIGLRLAAPGDDWRSRPDMDPQATSLFRASVVARARCIEDLVIEQTARGVGQYVILGAGLDSFAQRRPEVASRLIVFEVDQRGPQAWKRQRLLELGYGVPHWLRLVPVNFETDGAWVERLANAGFHAEQPAVVSSAGVSLYLTKDAIAATLRQIAKLAPGSTFAMTYLVPPELSKPEEQAGRQAAEQGARASGTPFLSFFSPAEMMRMAQEAGFPQTRRVTAAELTQRYFLGRGDGLRLGGSEELLIATL